MRLVPSSTSPTRGVRLYTNSCSPCRIMRPGPRSLSIGSPFEPPSIVPQYVHENGNVGGTMAPSCLYCAELSFTAVANARTGPDSTRTFVLPSSVPFSSVIAPNSLPPESHAGSTGAALAEQLCFTSGDRIHRPALVLLDLAHHRPSVHQV